LAIEAIRTFADGGKRTVHLRDAALAALTAAREVGDLSAGAAARSAGYAAATAFTKALIAPHHAKHALAPAVYSALARELAGEVGSGADDEIKWAIDNASPEIRHIISRWPARSVGRTRLDGLFYQLDSGLRD
jgi:hypothetical protein